MSIIITKIIFFLFWMLLSSSDNKSSIVLVQASETIRTPTTTNLRKRRVQQQKRKRKVYLLIGQSNMEGSGHIAHLDDLVKSEDGEYNYLWNSNTNDFETRSDIKLIFNKATDEEPILTDLTVGYGYNPRDRFGPEIGFGWTLANDENNNNNNDDEDEELPIILLKCAKGGTHLGIEWQSPSNNKVYDTSDLSHITPDSYGQMWYLMIDMIHSLQTDREDEEIVIEGIVWFQGWNDAFNDEMRDDYYTNLSDFVQDLMDEFGLSVPILIGELGQEGIDKPLQDRLQKVEQIKASQLSVVQDINLSNVVYVETSPYVYSGTPYIDAVHHYFGHADTILQIGTAFATTMLQILQQQNNPMAGLSAAPPLPTCLINQQICTNHNQCCSNRCWDKECHPPIRKQSIPHDNNNIFTAQASYFNNQQSSSFFRRNGGLGSYTNQQHMKKPIRKHY